MTDLTPNDLSHLSDEEFNALCPQGEHAPGPEPLSPAAQAVLDAAFGRWMEIDDISDDIPGKIAVAALRAAADQLAQVPIVIGEPLRGNIAKDAAVVHVADLFAIADELENQ